VFVLWKGKNARIITISHDMNQELCFKHQVKLQTFSPVSLPLSSVAECCSLHRYINMAQFQVHLHYNSASSS
jgi:hypothetical protein